MDIFNLLHAVRMRFKENWICFKPVDKVFAVHVDDWDTDLKVSYPDYNNIPSNAIDQLEMGIKTYLGKLGEKSVVDRSVL